MSLEHLLFTAGLLHFCQLPAMFVAPHMLDWKRELALLSPINRRIVKVIGLSIMYVVLASGLLVMWSASELTNGSKVSTGLTAFLAFLWLFRGSMQWSLYSKAWPSNKLGRLSHYGLGILFLGLAAIYLFALAANLDLLSAE